MPHCIPQNEQCVLTNLSGASFDDLPQPPGGVKFRCGPYRSASCSDDSGGCATSFLLAPQLRVGECGAFASGAECLPMPGGAFDAVIESELRQHLPKIFDLQLRCETLFAARAVSALVFVTGCLVHLDADLRRSL